MEHVLRTKTHTRGLCLIVTPDELGSRAADPEQMAAFVRRTKDTFARWA